MNEDVLVIGAKAPVPGLVKTRLGRAVGHERATALYAAFLRDIAARFRGECAYDVLWAVSPADADWGGRGGILDDHETQRFAQVGPNWTERQRAIFRETADRGYAHAVLIASDSPHLSGREIAAAFAALGSHAAVLTPTYDGGYSLIGQRRGVDILADTPMSTGTVCADLWANARRAGRSLALLPPTWDVDEVADLAHLAAYLAGPHDAPATAAAFAALGLAACVPPKNAALQQTGGGT